MARPGRQPARKPSVMELTAILRRSILVGELKPGDRLAGLRELAAKHGVSTGSIRRAVLELERDGLLTRRWGSGCYVSMHPQNDGAASPVPSVVKNVASSSTSSRPFAIVLPYEGHFFDRVTRRLCELAQQRGLMPITLRSPDVAERDNWSDLLGLIEQWRDNPPLAVVGTTMPMTVARAIEDVCAARSHLIGVHMADGPSRPHLWHRIMPQMARVGELAAQRFVDAGHRRIGLMTSVRRIHPDILPRSVRKRFYGHTELILALGRGLRQRIGPGALTVHYNLEYPQSGSVVFSQAEMERIVRFLQREPRPTALIGLDFRMVGAMQAWRAAGLPVGELPALTGIGNTPWSQAWGFDSYCMQPERMAEAAMALLDRPVAPEAPAEKIRIEPVLIERGQFMPATTGQVLAHSPQGG